jgi:hypothetical protein
MDGWFFDHSSISATHPSAFLRSWCLLGYWLDFLRRQREAGWREWSQPSSLDLMDVARSFIMVDWIAGRFRAERDGLAIWSELDRVHEMLCEAAGCNPHVTLNLDVPFG